MINALPGFSGHVPEAIARVYPNATLRRSADWNGFSPQYSEGKVCAVRQHQRDISSYDAQLRVDYLLAPTDPLFQTLGKVHGMVKT